MYFGNLATMVMVVVVVTTVLGIVYAAIYRLDKAVDRDAH